MARIEVVLGLGFGDEGKGTLVDWLARRGPPPLVIRWTGGPQAQHHVVTDDGRLHCFAQLGSGLFVAGARTHLGPEMAVDLHALHAEAAAIAAVGVPDALARLTIDPRARLVLPWHAIVGQIREALRGAGRHGSTGRGVAEAKLGPHFLRAAALGRPGFAAAVEAVRAALHAEARALAAASADPVVHALAARAADRVLVASVLDAASRLGAGVLAAVPPAAEHVILEGAQGVLLDRDHGFAPHVTPSRLTRRAAEAACADLGLTGALEVWGVLRAMHTRHGAGPFPSASAALTRRLPEAHNRGDEAAGPFRVGWFDGVLARYALAVAGPIDRLAVTCVDRSPPDARVVRAWAEGELTALPPARRTELAARATPELAPAPDITSAIATLVGQPIDLTSHGPTARAKTVLSRP